jgi:hypothetical protein
MNKTILAVALVLGASAAAQTPSEPKGEVRPFVGASIPTGELRDAYASKPILGLQGAVQVTPTFHLVSSFGWVPSKAKYAVANRDVNVFQYDGGVELGLMRQMGRWQFKPFLGLGAGARTYLYSSPQLTDRTCLSGYGTVGSELQVGRTAVRLEARDNVFCYKSPMLGEASKTRNDVGLALGVAYHFRFW